VVYKARDTMLDRLVALKFLPAGLTSDSESTQRFIREAKAGASSDHPNICTIYEIARSDDGQMFIAMAFYEGSTLRERLGDGPLEYREAIDIVRQIGAGLSAAHEKGVTHRDIKPGNIQITEAGQVKILDFGLAKLKGGIDLTRTGSTHGTPAYMSPEQIRGDEIDERTDIWSLGAVLFELLSGMKAFEGDYEQAIAYSIMHGNPDLTRRLGGEIPPGLALVLRKALEKDPDLRYQSVAEFLADLPDEPDAASTSASLRLIAGTLSYRLRRERFKIAATGIAAIAIVWVWLGGSGRLGRGKSAVVRPVETQLTFDGISWNPSMSPDGEFVAYVQFNSDGLTGEPWPVKLHDIKGNATSTVFLSDSGDVVRVGSWAPDGTRFLIRIVSSAGQDLAVIPRLGGEPRVVARRNRDGSITEFGWKACWSRDGYRVYSADSLGIYAHDVRSGENSFRPVEGLAGALPYRVDISCSPVDETLLLTLGTASRGAQLVRLDPESLAKKVIFETKEGLNEAIWSSDGRSIYFTRGFVQDVSVLRLDLDENGDPLGPPREVLSAISTSGRLSLSADNSRLVLNRRHTTARLMRVDLNGGEIQYKELDRSTLLELMARISPDGETVLFNRRGDLYEMPTQGGQARQITRLGGVQRAAWSHDGSRIAFTRRDTVASLWVINRDGTNPHRLATPGFEIWPGPVDWLAPDEVAVNASDRDLLLLVNPDNDETRPFPPGVRTGSFQYPRRSPDGAFTALVGAPTDRQDDRGIWLFSHADSSLRKIHSEGFAIDWSDDGRSLYVFDEQTTRNFELVDASTGKATRLIDGNKLASTFGMKSLYLEATWVSRHDNTFAMTVYEGLSDIWIIDNFDPTRDVD